MSTDNNPRPWKKDVTIGEWRFVEYGDNDCGNITGLGGAVICHFGSDIPYENQCGNPPSIADQALMIEAGTVFHQTGMTPGELAEENKTLASKIKGLKKKIQRLESRWYWREA